MIKERRASRRTDQCGHSQTQLTLMCWGASMRREHTPDILRQLARQFPLKQRCRHKTGRIKRVDELSHPESYRQSASCAPPTTFSICFSYASRDEGTSFSLLSEPDRLLRSQHLHHVHTRCAAGGQQRREDRRGHQKYRRSGDR